MSDSGLTYFPACFTGTVWLIAGGGDAGGSCGGGGGLSLRFDVCSGVGCLGFGGGGGLTLVTAPDTTDPSRQAVSEVVSADCEVGLKVPTAGSTTSPKPKGITGACAWIRYADPYETKTTHSVYPISRRPVHFISPSSGALRPLL